MWPVCRRCVEPVVHSQIGVVVHIQVDICVCSAGNLYPGFMLLGRTLSCLRPFPY